MDSNVTTASGDGRSVTRRRFLWWSSATAVTSWFGGSVFAQEVSLPATGPAIGLGAVGGGSGAGSGMPAISVGYVLGSEQLPDVARPDWWSAVRDAPAAARAFSSAGDAAAVEVVPATTLLGDPRLAVVPVQVAVLGLYPQVDDVPGSTFDLLLTVNYATGDPFLPEVPFHAWGWRDDPASTSGSPLRFTVPVERERGLRLSLDVREVQQGRRAAASGGGRRVGRAARRAWSQETVLSVGLEPHLPKLQRGIYLLGLEPSTWERGGELWAGALPSELPPSLVVAVEEAPEAAEPAP